MIVPPAELQRPPCPVCGTGMDGRRESATYCSDACRAEASRLRRLLAGDAVGAYASIHERLATWGTRGAPRRARAAITEHNARQGA